LRARTAVVLVVEGERACLLAATSISPDVVLLDTRLSRCLLVRLRSRPLSKHAQVSSSAALATTREQPVRVEAISR
jgi:replication-associated recombination protein RarA